MSDFSHVVLVMVFVFFSPEVANQKFFIAPSFPTRRWTQSLKQKQCEAHVFHHVCLFQMCCKVKRSSLEDLMSGKHLVESESRRMGLMRMFVNITYIRVALTVSLAA